MDDTGGLLLPLGRTFDTLSLALRADGEYSWLLFTAALRGLSRDLTRRGVIENRSGIVGGESIPFVALRGTELLREEASFPFWGEAGESVPDDWGRNTRSQDFARLEMVESRGEEAAGLFPRRKLFFCLDKLVGWSRIDGDGGGLPQALPFFTPARGEWRGDFSLLAGLLRTFVGSASAAGLSAVNSLEPHWRVPHGADEDLLEYF